MEYYNITNIKNAELIAMKTTNILNKLSTVSALAICALTAGAFSVNLAIAQAHVHGEGQLLVAQEGNIWKLQFVLPAADVLGFEHKPETKAQREGVASLISSIESVSALVEPPAGCKLDTFAHSLEKAHKAKDEHGHKDKDEHKHEHEHDHDGKHDDEHEGHSDVDISYTFMCSKNLSSLQVNIFTIAPSLQSLDAQWIVESGQGASQLSANANVLSF